MNMLRFGLVALVFLPAAHAQSPAAARMQPVAPPQPIAMPVTPPVAVPPVPAPIKNPVVSPTPVPGPKIVVAPPVQKKPVETKPPHAGKPDFAGRPEHAGKPAFVTKPGGPLLTPLDDPRIAKKNQMEDKSALDQHKLQDSMEKQTRAQQTKSNASKKISDTQQGIVQNIK